MSSVRTRIAPSPTGHPHIGTIFQALLNYIYARKHDGQFIIRIEDTDRARLVKDAENKLYQALEWFDLLPDEGPVSGGEVGPYRQSERLDIYQEYAQKLIDNAHAYYCFCSPKRLNNVRQKMQQEGRPPMYDQQCRRLDPDKARARALKEPHVIRLKVPASETITFNDVIRGQIEFDSDTVDDQVLLKSDGYPTYHLAVVVDDHLMKITHMVRGEEWISSTPKHVLLYRYFGWGMPAFIHTPLLRNPDKSKLSKRHGHASVDWYINQGYLKEAILNFLATRVWNHPEGQEIFARQELEKYFEFRDMHIQGPIVDLDKLDWINGQWIRRLKDKELLDRLKPYRPEQLSQDTLEQVLPLIKDRLVKLSDITQLTQYFYRPPQLTAKEITKQSRLSLEETAEYIQKVVDLCQSLENWKEKKLEKELRELQQTLNLKPKAAFMTLRIALTGQTATPPLFDVMEILGKKAVVDRLDTARSILQTE